MAKYSQPCETTRIMEVWKSMPVQLLQENNKFKYKNVRSGGRASQFESAIAWLETAGLANRCINVTSGELPLALHENRKAFKMYILDTGLLSSMINLPTASVINNTMRASINVGAVVENYVAQSLAGARIDLRYWTSKGKAEVDFVAQLDRLDSVVPKCADINSSTNSIATPIEVSGS